MGSPVYLSNASYRLLRPSFAAQVYPMSGAQVHCACTDDFTTKDILLNAPGPVLAVKAYGGFAGGPLPEP